MPVTKKPTFLSEDVSMEVLVHGDNKPEFLLHFVNAAYIYRVAESIEHRNMCCVWINGENEEAPLIVNALVGDMYVAWVDARKNIYLNQISLNQ